MVAVIIYAQRFGFKKKMSNFISFFSVEKKLLTNRIFCVNIESKK